MIVLVEVGGESGKLLFQELDFGVLGEGFDAVDAVDLCKDLVDEVGVFSIVVFIKPEVF